MNASKLREMTIEELQEKLRKEKEALFKLRFRAATGKLENPMKIRTIRREIARVITTLGEKERSARIEG